MRTAIPLVAVLSALIPAAASAQTMYKCVQGERTVYQAEPCPDTAKQDKLKAQIPLPRPRDRRGADGPDGGLHVDIPGLCRWCPDLGAGDGPALCAVAQPQSGHGDSHREGAGAQGALPEAGRCQAQWQGKHVPRCRARVARGEEVAGPDVAQARRTHRPLRGPEDRRPHPPTGKLGEAVTARLHLPGHG
ncbi:MAG: DUF4124 domain-containing protein [Betaproteobacteria bacterium]|nr:DUF4124 domain-containing protein [Betaproteobacteria bacterium]